MHALFSDIHTDQYDDDIQNLHIIGCEDGVYTRKSCGALHLGLISRVFWQLL